MSLLRVVVPPPVGSSRRAALHRRGRINLGCIANAYTTRRPSPSDGEKDQWHVRAARLAVALFAAALPLLQPVPVLAAFSGGDESSLTDEELGQAWTGGEREFRALTREEAERKRYLFTDDAYEGMLVLADYAEYVERVAKPLEAGPGCAACEKNRGKLERAWQNVANEMYVPKYRGGFSQAEWTRGLLETLRAAGGALETTEETDIALRGMVASDFRRALRRPLPAERDYLERQFVGVGLQLGEPCAEGWTITAPLAGSPAEEAGIRRGAALVSVDGVPVRGLSVKEVESLLRGPAGSVAELDISIAPQESREQPSNSKGVRLASNSAPSQPPPPSTTTMQLERRELPLPPVQWTPLASPDSSGLVEYVRINYFSSDGTKALARAIVEGESLGVDGYVIDVRNNPGGILEEGIASASLFLPCGLKVATSIRGEDVPDITYYTCRLPSGQFDDLPVQLTAAPLTVLANSSSASASEVFAAALRDNARGLIVGERTFGKGLVQFFFPLGDGSGLRLSVLKWISPTGADTDAQVGLTPDVACSDFPRGAAKEGGSVDACIAQAERLLAQAAAAAAQSGEAAAAAGRSADSA